MSAIPATVTIMRTARTVVGVPLLLGALSGCASDDEVEVPNVVGLVDVEAWYALGEAGLEWEYADPDFGGTVIVEGLEIVVSDQEPPAGSTANRGDVVLLTFRQVRSG